MLITLPWMIPGHAWPSLANHDRAPGAAAGLGTAAAQGDLARNASGDPAALSPAALFGFVVSFGNLELTLFLAARGPTTLPISILQLPRSVTSIRVAAMSVAQVVLVGVAMILLDR